MNLYILKLFSFYIEKNQFKTKRENELLKSIFYFFSRTQHGVKNKRN